MKKRIITPFLFLILITGFSQNLNFEVHGNYTHPIKVEKLQDARSMGDIIPYYPAGWIMSYVTVEMSAISDGNTLMATGTNDILTAEQIILLNSAEIGTEIVINIRYLSENSVNNESEERSLHYSTTVVPEIQAEYPSGYQHLAQYLKENAIDKISENESGKIELAVVRFTVNEEGQIDNAQISKTSGNPEIDKLLLGVINNMPKWRPAEDSNGMRVGQEFEFTVGNNSGC
jgi:TonB family protein